MRLVHMADTHLGFKRYQRQTASGENQREADVALAFVRAIDQTIALAPDVVIIAGDVFHQPRPSNPSIVHAVTQLRRLTAALPDAIVVMLAGNHDLSRTSETCILRVFAQMGVHVVDRAVERLRFPARELAILCVPEVDALAAPLAPDPTARVNVLAIHGEVRGLIKGSRAPLVYDADTLAAPAWDYVALGYYHDFTQVAPRAFYSGAIDFTTSDTWHEAPAKGLIEYDLEAHTHTFHTLPASRPHVDLPPLDGASLSVAELNERIAAAVALIGGVDDKVVRLVIRNLEPTIRRDLDQKLIRDCKARATNFTLETRAPEHTRVDTGSLGSARWAAAPLRELLQKELKDRPPLDDVEPEALVALGLAYLDRTEDASIRVTSPTSQAA